MSDPVRIQLSRKAGWRMPPNTVKVTRPYRWGNPFEIRPAVGMTRERCLTLFRQSVMGGWCPTHVEDLSDEQAAAVYAAHCAFRERVGAHAAEFVRAELRGKNLACWCPLGQPCHADVLLEIANPRTTT